MSRSVGLEVGGDGGGGGSGGGGGWGVWRSFQISVI